MVTRIIRRSTPPLLACGLGLLTLASDALRADWLLARDGARIETKGPWTVKGNQVVFHQPNGTLSSLRLANVDLDASTAATAQAAASRVQVVVTPPPPRKPVLVLTEKDLPPVTEEKEGAGAAPAKDNATESGGTDPLAVTSWEQVMMPQAIGTQIVGTVTNQGGAIVTGGTVVVSLYDDRGAVLVIEQAELPAKPISPGQAATFVAEFPGLSGFADAKFAVSSRGFRVAAPAPQGGNTRTSGAGAPPPPEPSEPSEPPGDGSR